MHLLIDETARLIHGLEHAPPRTDYFYKLFTFFHVMKQQKTSILRTAKTLARWLLRLAPSTARPRTGLRVIQFHSQAA